MSAGSDPQAAEGSDIAQASNRATAIVDRSTHYHDHHPIRFPTPGADEIAAAKFRLSSLPAGHVPEVAPLPLGSYLPWSVNPAFVGREADLKQLASVLKGGDTAAIGQVAVATGLGGIGKTELASAFAHCYGQYFQGGVHWVSMAEAAGVPAEVARCGDTMFQEAGFGELPIEEQVRLVTNAWQGPLPRLLVFDNCEDEDLLARWRPVSGGSRVLVTSRRSGWSSGLGVRNLALGVLSRAESIALLRKHREDIPPDDPALAEIARELGDLPLALHLAGSFLKRYQHSALGESSAYLADLQREDLLTHRSMTEGDYSPTGHEVHVAKTFALSVDRLKTNDALDVLAGTLLVFAACFAPGLPIPRSLLLATVEGSEDSDQLLHEDALRRLLDLGLLAEEIDGSLVSHRLLAHFVQIDMGYVEDACAVVESVVLRAAFDVNGSGLPRLLIDWQGQLRFVAEQAATNASELASSLLGELGHHLVKAADYFGAESALQKAIEFDEQASDKAANLLLIKHLNSLSEIHRIHGDFVSAKLTIERALSIAESCSEPKTLEIATCTNNLGLSLMDAGDFEGARSAFERALAITENCLGPDHPMLIGFVINHGQALHELGELDGAQASFERVFEAAERAFGEYHPSFSALLSNLGGVLEAKKDLNEAREAFERALAIDENVFGPEHPSVAVDLNNLGGVMMMQSDFVNAKAAFERAFIITEKVFGPKHINVAVRGIRLAEVLIECGERHKARLILEGMGEIFRESFKSNNPRAKKFIQDTLLNLKRVMNK